MRGFLTLMATWALLIAPNLCMGGWLAHACAPECGCDATDCIPADLSDHHDDEGDSGRCGHEPECGNDPCAMPIVRSESDDATANADVAIPAGFAPLLSVTDWHPVDLTSRSDAIRQGSIVALLNRSGLQCLSTVLPLLI